MPPRPPVPATIKAEVLWTQNSIPAANVLHVGYSSAAPIPADLVLLGEALSNAIKGALQASYTPEHILTEVICTDIATDSGSVGSYSVPWLGTDSDADAISAGSSLMINWQQQRRYRGGKPRTYLPAGGASHMLTVSQWGPTQLASLAAAAVALQAAGVGTYGELHCTGLGCVSYVYRGVARIDPIFEVFTGYTVSSFIRSQRRRVTASSF